MIRRLICFVFGHRPMPQFYELLYTISAQHGVEIHLRVCANCDQAYWQTVRR